MWAQAKLQCYVVMQLAFRLLPKLSICAQTDLEEAKGQEITKLQQSLQAMQSKVDETNALLLKEREAAQKAIEEASSIVQETPVPVEDTEKIDALTAEVENLKVMPVKCDVIPSPLFLIPFSILYYHPQSCIWSSNSQELLQSEKERADTSERKAAEVLESSNEKSQRLEETEKRVHQLQESLNRQHNSYQYLFDYPYDWLSVVFHVFCFE